MARRRSRHWLTLAATALIAGALAWAFWPRPVLVDLGRALRAPMIVTIDAEAKTRVRDAYVVSAPIAGRLQRVEVEPGDPVEGGVSVIAHMLPTNPAALDIRTREQALAAVNAAEAALRAARADLSKAMADNDLAEADLARTETLRKSGTVAQAVLDRAEREARAAAAQQDMAEAAISMREADLANARARLIDFTDRTDPGSGPALGQEAIPLRAPITGRVLRVMQVSETTLPAGEPILEIGDISNDLEIVAELLSGDAVRVTTGDRVIVDDWGGPRPLDGIVQRVEPWGFTKFSALGVEEQRVNVIIGFTGPPEERPSLGHGFRVEVGIVIWENPDALTLPSSALFRDAGGWAVFAVEDGRARLTPVEIGQDNGQQAEVLGGIDPDASVILYPGPGLADGTRVAKREIG